jgi:hypothetical protein
MSDDYFVEVLLKPDEHVWLMRALQVLSLNPLIHEDDKKTATEMYDKLKDQFDE